ncbi:hypothetical protein H2199_009140 [Coniosporium tulheliwenetii]|uniref:Uncharacterized protein n=1 Tax=Coniosporium tulheliwenetii TaxID=3383036 RepID=A0ACC2YFT4_9PEZI|nr:hypothetical protein H2199_009140 [Cladosporium sp. JES 115]
MSGNLGAPDEVVLREYDPPKAAQPSATFSGSYHHKIAFRHPGYRDEFEQNVLLTLYAFDNHSRALHHATAHTVCALVACNAWDGYFTRTRDGERLQLTADGLLTEKEYYFHVPGNTRYPVYPTFSSWKFPKDNLPPHWPEEIQDDGEDGGGLVAPPSVSGVTKAVITRDRGCVISKDQDYVEKAHLCPQSEAEWFRINGMGDYNLNDTLADEVITDDISNAIGLRPDIHKAFDDRRFVIVRKHGQWVVHFINLTQNLGRRYHNIPLKLQTGVSARCLLIRFAWAIFPSVKKFLTRGASHALLYLHTPPDSQKQHKPPETVEAPSAGTTYRSPNPYAGIAEKLAEKERLDKLRISWIRCQRPSNPDLICCDYNAASAAYKAGIQGRAKWGGSHLCEKCLGVEYAEDRDDDEDLPPWDNGE